MPKGKLELETSARRKKDMLYYVRKDGSLMECPRAKCKGSKRVVQSKAVKIAKNKDTGKQSRMYFVAGNPLAIYSRPFNRK